MRKIIKVTDEIRIKLGHEAVDFLQKDITRKGRRNSEIIDNRFIGNCRNYIYSQTMNYEFQFTDENHQGWTYNIDNKKTLVKPFYMSPICKLHRECCLIGDATVFLLNPSFNYLALVYFNKLKSEGYVKAIIPKKIYLKNMFIDTFQYKEKVFIYRNIINEYEYKG